MKKKGVIIPALIVLVLVAALFLPIPKGSYDDSGTRVYDALTYKIVEWNRTIAEADENGEFTKTGTYHKTSIFWYPDNKRSIDELWKMEKAESGKSVRKIDGAIFEDTSYSYVIDSASFDIDKDGKVENCTISLGPTSGLYTVVITAATDEGIKYKNTFCLACCGIKFCQENGVTKVSLTGQIDQTGTETGETYDISVKNDCIVIENADEFVTYWGGAEWNWNLK